MSRRWCSYARQSLAPQNGKLDSVSIADQHRSNAEWAERNYGRVVARYDDVDTSGAAAVRDGLDRMFADLPGLSVDGVIIRDISRLARDTRLFLTFSDELRRRGLQLVSATENLEDRTLTTVLSAFAERERLNIAARVAGGVREHARRGKHIGNVPFGYRRVNGQMIVIEAEAAIVRALYERFAAGSAMVALMPLARSLRPLPASGMWTLTAVSKLLRRPTYAGDVAIAAKRDAGGRLWPAVSVQDAHPAIIDRALWEIVQRRLNGNRSHIHAEILTPYQGMVWCAGCGSRCYPSLGSPSVYGARYVNVKCRSLGEANTRNDRWPACPSRYRSISGIKLDRMVRAEFAAMLRGRLSDADLRRHLAQPRRETATAERRIDAQLREIATRRARLLDAYESGQLDLTTWVARDKALGSSESDLAAQRDTLVIVPDERAVTATLDAIRGIADAIDGLDDNDLRGVLIAWDARIAIDYDHESVAITLSPLIMSALGH